MIHQDRSRDCLQGKRCTNQRAHTSKCTRRYRIACPRIDGHFDSMQGGSKRQTPDHHGRRRRSRRISWQELNLDRRLGDSSGSWGSFPGGHVCATGPSEEASERRRLSAMWGLPLFLILLFWLLPALDLPGCWRRGLLGRGDAP